MTADRDLERRLRDGMRVESASTGFLDLHAAAIARAGRSRQRPAWLVAIRGGTIASPVTPRQRWLLMLLAGVALLLVAFATALLAGAGTSTPLHVAVTPVPAAIATARPSPPHLATAVAIPAPPTFPPFAVGPLSANGPMYFGDAQGDIRSIDLDTGNTSVIVGGKPMDDGPWFSPDGSRFIFLRSDPKSLQVADADGSNVRTIAPGRQLTGWDWSPNGDRIAGLPDGGSDQVVVIAPTSGDRTTIPLSTKATHVWWLTDDLLIVISDTAAWTIKADGTDQTELDLPEFCCGGISVLPGTGVFAWSSWGPHGHGKVHLHDTSTGVNVDLQSTMQDNTRNYLDPRFSPDGTMLTAVRAQGPRPSSQLVLLKADGSGTPIPIGPAKPTYQAVVDALFSPDGTDLMVAYEGSAIVVSLPDLTIRELPWSSGPGRSWRPMPSG